MPEKHWKSIGESRFPWEREALDFIFERFPAQDNYLAWSLFEFVADDGSINEVDAFVVCPQGAFLIEIKSRPGIVRGDQTTWTWEHEGHQHTEDNPVLLANRKCKRLKGLLARQRAFRSLQVPFIEPVVFLSHSQVRCQLEGSAANYVCLRDVEPEGGKPGRPGIMAVIRRREGAGLKQFDSSPLNRPLIRAVAQAMEQAGFRPTQRARRVGDFTLQQLLFESATGSFQDWLARHVSYEKTTRRARIYMVSRQATREDREILRSAAEREFKVLERLDHPGVVRADVPTECEYGPVLFLRTDPEAQRLDHFLQAQGSALSVDHRLDILRQVTDVVRYAHGKRVIHRSLSPQSILVKPDAKGGVAVQVFNWQTGIRLPGGSTADGTRVSATLHAGQLLEDASLVFLAPEALTGGADGGAELDIFSLGALAYYLFTGKPPAASQAELQDKLRQSSGLNISEALDGAVDALKDLVKFSANADASLRFDIEDFLAHLDDVEDELTRPSVEWASPLEATKGDRLEGGFKVVKKLGGGAVAVVLLVETGGEQVVLKVSRKPEYNARLKSEYDVLKRLRWPTIVNAYDLVQFGELTGFTMEPAGEATLAHQLREDGPLDLTLLQQFGEDLLRAIEYLDKEGIAHRDIKPDNVGIRTPRAKKRTELCLFDFSLAGTPPENINVGTIPYLDQFLSNRKVKRWDASSECFSAAMTLHEMATGVLPRWGDGRSLPNLIADEVAIRPELFPAELRDRFKLFFEKALRREYTERFDNPAQMLEAWRKIFATIDRPATATATDAAFVLDDQMAIGEGTQLILLALSTRLSNALDRLNIHTVGQLLRFPLRSLYRLRGVGHKTRRELARLFKELRQRCPGVEAAPGEIPTETGEEAGGAPADSLERIARLVATTGRGTRRDAEQDVLQRFLGWVRDEKQPPTYWISQADLASALVVTRQRVGQALIAGRKRWHLLPSVAALGDEILEVLRAKGGIATHEEVIQAILAAHPSELDEPASAQMGSIVTRAALEVEKQQKQPRYDEYRTGGRIFLSTSAELKGYALRLGHAADRLAGLDPLPTPARVLETLRQVPPAPEVPDCPPPGDSRLPQLAVAAAEKATLSSRLEIYPRGLAPDRALAQAQNALFGGTLTVEEIRNRVHSRYPEAAPLPDHPVLETLIQRLGLDLKWNPQAADGKGAYEPTYRESLSIQTSEPSPERRATRFTPTPPVGVDPKVAEARALEDKLQYCARQGAFLVLSVEAALMHAAQEELKRRFPVSLCNLDEIFLGSLRRHAEQRGAKWDVILRADDADSESPDWRKLQRLVDECLPEIEQSLRSRESTRLVVNPGLLARYDRMELLARAADEVGRTGGTHGLWVLVPANDQTPFPTLNQKAIPITNAAQHARLTETWVINHHRAAPSRTSPTG
jgi:serine/threonine protein kinase